MYSEEQQISHIRGLQQDLRVVQAALGEPLPKISGVYDSATQDAVRRFQRRFGLPITGKTDLNTWDRIVQESNRMRSQSAIPLAVRVFPNAAHIVAPGDHGRFIYILQAILNGLSAGFPNLQPVPYSGVYDLQTEQAVRMLQQTAGLTRTGKLDAATWNAIAHFYSQIGVHTKDKDDCFT